MERRGGEAFKHINYWVPRESPSHVMHWQVVGFWKPRTPKPMNPESRDLKSRKPKPRNPEPRNAAKAICCESPAVWQPSTALSTPHHLMVKSQHVLTSVHCAPPPPHALKGFNNALRGVRMFLGRLWMGGYENSLSSFGYRRGGADTVLLSR